MEAKRNYQKELENIIEAINNQEMIPKLFLHSCCAPCSSYVLEYLSDYFEITLFYYNPNIFQEEEYFKRIREQERLIRHMPVRNPVHFTQGKYEPEAFFGIARGLEDVKEGGERCFRCYELRMREAALQAKARAFDYFTTTLSISPLKNAAKINEIGEAIGREIGIPYLPSDFKKKNGYKRSLELSKAYGLYRQDYCGCMFSRGGNE